jgi:predicted nucleic acid-binding protein
MMVKIFADTDILLDLLSERQPYYAAAAKLFSLADNRKIKIHISALSFANLHYILRKQYTAKGSRQILQRLKVLTGVLAVNDKIIELALSSDFSDFEDAVQYYTATENSIELLLTRNLKDYKKSQIPVMTAEDFIKGVKRENEDD